MTFDVPRVLADMDDTAIDPNRSMRTRRVHVVPHVTSMCGDFSTYHVYTVDVALNMLAATALSWA